MPGVNPPVNGGTVAQTANRAPEGIDPALCGPHFDDRVNEFKLHACDDFFCVSVGRGERE